jgi:RES domain-containing protein
MMAPWRFADGRLIGWRLDAAPHAATWDSGIGAERWGGRWNPKGIPVVYASADPSTAILEVAVHKGFAALDTIPHMLTAFVVKDVADVAAIDPVDVPNPAWLWPGTPSAGQKSYGADMLGKHPFLLIPSAVSSHAWNLVFTPQLAAGRYEVLFQERFALDTRLNPQPPRRPGY